MFDVNPPDAVSARVVVPIARDRTGEADVAALIRVVRNAGLDLRQRMFVAFVIDFGVQREDAYAAARLLRDTDWNSSLYGDPTGWVVRMCKTQRLTSAGLAADLAEVNRVSDSCRGQVRGITVEDLRQDDEWSAMATRLQDDGRRADDANLTVAAVPKPRRQMPMHA
jgi:hypothetical protein